MMKKLLLHLSLVLVLSTLIGCASTKLTQQYKNPETVNFEANKILIIGITPDKTLRRAYEGRITEAFEKEGVFAVKSIDFFEKSFTDNKKSIEQLNRIEDQLLEAGFDAILFTKVTGSQSKVTLVDAYRNFSKTYQSFEDYYYSNQHLYAKEQREQYRLYTTETSLFCICPGKERELLWRGEMEMVEASKVNQNIKSYIAVLFESLKENKLLLL